MFFHQRHHRLVLIFCLVVFCTFQVLHITSTMLTDDPLICFVRVFPLLHFLLLMNFNDSYAMQNVLEARHDDDTQSACAARYGNVLCVSKTDNEFLNAKTLTFKCRFRQINAACCLKQVQVFWNLILFAHNLLDCNSQKRASSCLVNFKHSSRARNCLRTRNV